MEKVKVVVILSGGLDSVTLLHRFVRGGYDCYPITFSYGQKHVKEIEYAKSNVLRLDLQNQHKIVDVTALSDTLSSALIQEANAIPDTSSEEQRTPDVLKKTVVPFRNGIFLSIAIGYANSLGIKIIAYGAHKNDYATYPDCRPTFVHAMELAARHGLEDYDFRLLAPYVLMTKDEIVKEGQAWGVDFSLTWSCYRGGDKHCGNCPSCVERKNAFKEIEDPTVYDV